MIKIKKKLRDVSVDEYINKDLYSNKFLNQEIVLEDTLTKEEKEYLKAVIEPFKDRIQYITCCSNIFLDGFKMRNIEICVLEHEAHPCGALHYYLFAQRYLAIAGYGAFAVALDCNYSGSFKGHIYSAFRLC